MYKSARSKILINSLVVLCVIITMFPLIWVFVLAFLPEHAMRTYPPQLIPDSLYLDNFKQVLASNIPLGMRNSLIVVTLAISIVLVVSTFGSYGIARGSKKVRNAIYLLLLTTQMIPGVTNMVPLYRMMLSMDLLNTNIGLALIYAAGSLPLAMLILIGFFQSSVRELEEAAMIDGCNWLNVFWRIAIPLSKPGIVSAVIFTFAAGWNEFMMSMLMINDRTMMTVQVTLYLFMMDAGMRHLRYGQLTAGALFTLVPILIVYAIFQRGFVEGISAGSVK